MMLATAFPGAITDFMRSGHPLERLGVAALTIVLTAVLSGLARRRLGSTLERGGLQINVALLLSRLAWIGVWALGIAIILYAFGIGLGPLAAFVGVVGLAAGLALQQLLQNLVAGIYLLAERPFRIGDQIAVVGPGGANHEGMVEDIQMRTTRLRGRNDELILVPNASIFGGVVTNLTALSGHAAQLSLVFPRDRDPTRVQRQVVAIVEGLPGALTTPPPEIHIDKVSKDEWTATLVFWAKQADARSLAAWAIASAIPDACVDATGVAG
jgi:small-conductance mechanosensitive channel